MHYFFMGIAGAGMSALAQYIAGKGHRVSGSDRQFENGKQNKTQQILQSAGITCYPQDTTGIHAGLDAVVVSSAIEPTVPEYAKALNQGIPIMMRSDLLAEICNRQKTIAVAGTSGKSTVAAMVFEILDCAGFSPSLITGAGLIRLQEQQKIGNAYTGQSDYLVIEADESDGSLVKYKPNTGLILNIEKDHKTLNELYELFGTFANNVQRELIVNKGNAGSARFSRKSAFDFMDNNLTPKNLKQTIKGISFSLQAAEFQIPQIGAHTAENAAAAAAAALSLGVPLEKSAEALKTYKGICRRHQFIGQAGGITIIDDYAHNPAKLAASMRAAKAISPKVVVWFQAHGFGPTRFLRYDFAEEISKETRADDEIIFSEIYYAGGTVSKDISGKDLSHDLLKKGVNSVFIKDRNELPAYLKTKSDGNYLLLLCGARDPSLGDFAKKVYRELSS